MRYCGLFYDDSTEMNCTLDPWLSRRRDGFEIDMPPRAPPPFIPPPPSPESTPRTPNGHVSPPVIPSVSGSSALPNWGRPEQGHHGMDGYAAFSHTPYGAPGVLPAAAPGSYFIPPVALPHHGPPPTAPVGSAGFSVNYTGFPEYPSTPHSTQAPPSAAAAANTPWAQPGMFGGVPMQPPGPQYLQPPGPQYMQPPGTQYSAFQQALPFAYGGWPTPGVHPAALGTPYGGMPMQGGGWGQTPYAPPGLPPGFQTHHVPRGPPAENPRAQPPETKQTNDQLTACDKWSEEVQCK